MDDEVVVGIPVSPAAADLLRDDQRRTRSVGQLVSRLLKPDTPDTDPLRRLMAEISAEAHANGLTDADVDAELDTYNAEHRHRR